MPSDSDANIVYRLRDFTGNNYEADKILAVFTKYLWDARKTMTNDPHAIVLRDINLQIDAVNEEDKKNKKLKIRDELERAIKDINFRGFISPENLKSLLEDAIAALDAENQPAEPKK